MKIKKNGLVKKFCGSMLAGILLLSSFSAPAHAATLKDYDESDPKIFFSAGWGTFSVEEAYNGTVHSTSSAEAKMRAVFESCTAVEIYGGTGPNRGYFDVLLDGEKVGSINTYSQDVITNVSLYKVENLERGKHTVEIITTGTNDPKSYDTWVEIDRIASDGELIKTSQEETDPEQGNQIIDDALAEYNGTWTAYAQLDPARGYYLNTATSCTTAGNSVSYTFAYCTGIRWYSTSNGTYASADVYIDGKKHSTVNVGALKNSAPWAVFDSGELPGGTHTVTIVHAGEEGKWLEVDRLIGVGENKAGYSIVRAANPNFFAPIGSFSKENGTLHIKTPGSRVLFSFFGASAVITGQKTEGKAEIIVDGESRGEFDFNTEELFHVRGLAADSSHIIEIVLKEGEMLLQNAQIEEPYSVASKLNEQANEELSRIEQHEKEIYEESLWKPVSKKANMPERGVTLGNGVFLDAFNKNITYLKHCANKYMYADMTSVWTDALTASTEGRMMAGTGNSLRWIEDAELEAILDKLLAAIEARADANGWCLPYESDRFAPHPGDMIDEDRNYDRVMFTRGLVAAGKAGKTNAYTLLRNFYDWFNQCEYLPTMLSGGLGTQGSLGTILAWESPVGKAEDLYTNMKYYDMDWWLESLANGIPEAIYRYPLNRPHGYLLVSMESFLAEYIATGQEKYLNAVLGAWDIFHDYYVTTGGGICICEGPTYLPANYTLNTKHGVYENCNNVFWVELNSRLLELFPTEEKYAAQIEQCLYNMLLASQDQNGNIRYFQLYNGQKHTASAINTCCEIMGSGQLSSLPQYIYSVADDGIYVNLFASSSIEFEAGGKQFTLTSKTEFPYQNNVALTIGGNGAMKLRLRIPSWSGADTEIFINGEKIGSGKAGSYFEIDRAFADGDKITFTLHPETRLVPYTGETQVEDTERYALVYGPILMAAQGNLNFTHKIDNENVRTIHLGVDAKTLAQELKQEDGLRFTADILNGIVFVPYMSIQNESFSVFPLFEPKTDRTDDPTASATAPTPTASIDHSAPINKSNAAWIICGALVAAGGAAAAAVAAKKKRKS
ncbi:MAG: glycoside hydrolase family 127 protein [Clostridiales bacterium]|nr:glycoside hydrolase family 127 protein [Clostridiales bacterium]